MFFVYVFVHMCVDMCTGVSSWGCQRTISGVLQYCILPHCLSRGLSMINLKLIGLGLANKPQKSSYSHVPGVPAHPVIDSILHGCQGSKLGSLCLGQIIQSLNDY